MARLCIIIANGRTLYNSLRLCLLLAVGSLLFYGCSSSDGLTGTSAPVPWSDQITAAVNSAQQVDSSTILTTVMADPTSGLFSSNTNYETGPWDLTFEFRGGASGKDITVSFQSNEITSTKKVAAKVPPTYTVAKGVPTAVPLQTEEMSHLLATAKIGPQGVARILEQDAEAHAKQLGITVVPGLYLTVGHDKKHWLVTYRSTKRGAFDLHWDFSYIVDATSGEILERDYEQGGM